EAGRDPGEVDIWFTARSSLHEDRETAIDNVKASVSSILNHAMRFGLDGKHVPDHLRDRIQAYVDGYELYDHVLDAGRNPRRMAELGLTDYAIDRWALAGAPRDWIARIERLPELPGSVLREPLDWIARIERLAEHGARKLWVGVSGGDLAAQRHYLRLMGEEIMPRFAA